MPRIVHHTINTNNNAAPSASRIKISIGSILTRRTARLAALLCVAALAACRGPAPKAPSAPAKALFEPVGYGAIDGWRVDDVEQIAPALARQCALRTLPPGWATVCASWSERGSLPIRDWLQTQFEPHRILAVDSDGQRSAEGLITGYYEALLNGNRRRTGAFTTPLYRAPADLLTIDLQAVAPETANLRLRGRVDGKRVVPYHDRAAIDQHGALNGNELIWVDDPVEAFFLQIQGSGRVKLPDGSMVGVRYADQNGHPYKAIGRVLIERGLLSREQADAAGIKSWLRNNPAQAQEVMAANPSYVFFNEQAVSADPTEGPPGSLGAPLTPLRSIAVDRSKIPLGSLVFIDTVDPSASAADRNGAGRLARLVLAQDTGGAIRGPVRADLFWGSGAQAERGAGQMRANGRMWLLWPRGMALPDAR